MSGQLITLQPLVSGYGWLPNEIINDKRLSMKAKGLAVWLNSRPPGWRISLDGIAACQKDGRNAVKASAKELKQAGWLAINSGARRNGHFCGAVWTMIPPQAQNRPTVEASSHAAIRQNQASPQADNGAPQKPSTENGPSKQTEGAKQMELGGDAAHPSSEVPLREMHAVYVGTLGRCPPHPKLTPTRAQLYTLLWREQLAENGRLATWRQLCENVRDDPHLSTNRAYQMPESFLRNQERRERHVLDVLAGPAESPANAKLRRKWARLQGRGSS